MDTLIRVLEKEKNKTKKCVYIYVKILEEIHVSTMDYKHPNMFNALQREEEM